MSASEATASHRAQLSKKDPGGNQELEEKTLADSSVHTVAGPLFIVFAPSLIYLWVGGLGLDQGP